MNRIINFFPREAREALLADLSISLKCVISQRLVRAKSGGRIPAVEIMLNTPHIAELIKNGEMGEIKDAMEQSLAPGSQTFEQALFRALQRGSNYARARIGEFRFAHQPALADQQCQQRQDRRGRRQRSQIRFQPRHQACRRLEQHQAQPRYGLTRCAPGIAARRGASIAQLDDPCQARSLP
jgi:twitching motility protein PilU